MRTFYRPYGTLNDAGVPSPFTSAHSCRICRAWSEGLWSTDRERSEREMNRGICDACWPQIEKPNGRQRHEASARRL